MNKIILTITLIISIVFFIAIGCVAGVFYQIQKNASVLSLANESIKKSASAESTLSMLKSDVIASITAYGTILKIEGKNVTIQSKGQKSAVIAIVSNSTSIFSVTPSTDNEAQKTNTLSLSDLKPGNNVTMNMTITDKDVLNASSIYIILDKAIKAK